MRSREHARELIEEAGRLHGIDAANEVAGCVAIDASELSDSERPSIRNAAPRICEKCGSKIEVMHGLYGDAYEVCDC